MLHLSSEKLHITIAEKGAELQSITRSDLGTEYLWSGDPAFWGKKSPVLFPVVGGLKDNRYHYKGQTFMLGRHGFARDMAFTVSEQAAGRLTLQLSDNEDTRKAYPFSFRFSVRYTLQEEQLTVAYIVENTGQDELLFSVGGHPAFRVPLAEGTAYDDYYLYFNKEELAGRWPLSAGGQIERAPVPLLEHTQTLRLQKSLFYQDALVLKHLASTKVAIKSDATPRGLEMDFEGFPYLGIWAAQDADFVCLEPWCGIADHVDASGQLEEKEGIVRLAPGGTFEKAWSVRFF